MSEIPAAGNNSAFEDALQRAKEIASKIKPTDGPSSSLKRPLSDDSTGPESKKSFSNIDPYFDMMQAGGDMTEAGMPSTENILVPNKMVGLIIGRGGEQITRLQAESGCKIQMAQDSAGLQDRQCTLTGPPQAIAMAKSAIDRIIANEGSGGGAGPRGPHAGGPGGGGAGGAFFEMSVPGHKVGLIIGKGGETIKHLQEATGAKIVIIQDSAEYDTEKPLRITGTPDSVERAKSMVNEILNQNDDREMGFGRGRGRGRGGPGRGAFMGRGGRGGFGDRGPGHWGGPPGGPGGDYGGQHQDYVAVPASKCGLVIGKGGETIKNINQTTGAHCTVDKNAPPDAEEKNFIIRGTPDAVERAKAMILEKLGMSGAEAGGYGGAGRGGGAPYGAAPYGGGQYNAGGYQQDSVAVAQAGQPDYSAQWIEYYRSMGMTREAEAIEQQSRAARAAMPAQAVAQPAQAANGAANGADYSAQWAEYYRSMGKIKEAEAIEMQIKSKAPAPQAYAAPGAQYQGGYYGGAQPPAAAAYQGYPGYAA